MIQAKEETWSKISQPRLGIGFGARSNEVGMRILRADSQVLVDMWQNAVRRLRPLQLAVDEETRGFIQNEVGLLCKAQFEAHDMNRSSISSEHMIMTHSSGNTWRNCTMQAFFMTSWTLMLSDGLARQVKAISARKRYLLTP